MTTINEIIASGDIPLREELMAPVFVDMEIILKRVLPKGPNLVSINDEPIFVLKANTSKLPNPMSIAARIDIPLHLPKSLAYAIGNDIGITNIRNIS